MARLPNTATKAERKEAHKAKMAGKVFERNRLQFDMSEYWKGKLRRQAYKQMLRLARREEAASDLMTNVPNDVVNEAPVAA